MKANQYCIIDKNLHFIRNEYMKFVTITKDVGWSTDALNFSYSSFTKRDSQSNFACLNASFEHARLDIPYMPRLKLSFLIIVLARLWLHELFDNFQSGYSLTSSCRLLLFSSISVSYREIKLFPLLKKPDLLIDKNTRVVFTSTDGVKPTVA